MKKVCEKKQEEFEEDLTNLLNSFEDLFFFRKDPTEYIKCYDFFFNKWKPKKKKLKI